MWTEAFAALPADPSAALPTEGIAALPAEGIAALPAIGSSVLVVGVLVVAVTALADAASQRLRIPNSILLLLVGVLLSFLPFMPQVVIDPELVLMLALPPLIYTSGVGMSWPGFRQNLRPILLLAIGLVVVTAAAVAGAVHWLLGVPWAVAFILGAVVSPPDPVAPMAIARTLSVPQKLLTILEGEGLINDATALILLSFAVTAAVTGTFSLPAALVDFVVVILAELAWGYAVGWALLRLRHRVGSPQIEIMLALLTPFVAFWPPHWLGGSGVIAALAAGLYVSWQGPRFISPATRLQGYFVWGLIAHGLEGLVFVLTGLQAQRIASGLDQGGWQRVAVAGAVVSLVVIVVRFLWVFPATYLPRWLSPALRRRDPYPPWQQTFFIGFTGIRGAISLVAALSIPFVAGEAAFPERELILFTTFCVIVVTLVGQGLSLPWLLPRLGLVAAGRAEAAANKAREVQARILGVEAVLAALDKLAAAGADPAAVAVLRRHHGDRLAEYVGTAEAQAKGSTVATDARLQARLIHAERRCIARLYAERRITDDARRRVERELDLEDARNRHALESATGNRLADPEIEALF
ncbi:Na+/H+ antiporter [Polymorphobacter fuscus]|uniref:Na+/H+ antiporter n=1 Tax=Sandarakinorhabdus fusca TaxID=1439888 RepID=A0A7C9KIA9_9SPHN|nr:Na+/H+ antiporter [Polymorphobacter fuscus]KAB7646317.1 Na+/H+ antiporter [Polymorphobacter fuscus]MQT17540.1 Na+/H+ antiporter [Polymorphobacter fuscus]NJC09918.1 CPA1 family monovalent cation:H+ antiporter [Polymorphobacter fuscus]